MKTKPLRRKAGGNEKRKGRYKIMLNEKIVDAAEKKENVLTTKTWIIDYVIGNTYKVKIICAETAQKAIKKARIKNIVDINEKKEG